MNVARRLISCAASRIGGAPRPAVASQPAAAPHLHAPRCGAVLHSPHHPTPRWVAPGGLLQRRSRRRHLLFACSWPGARGRGWTSPGGSKRCSRVGKPLGILLTRRMRQRCDPSAEGSRIEVSLLAVEGPADLARGHLREASLEIQQRQVIDTVHILTIELREYIADAARVDAGREQETKKFLFLRPTQSAVNNRHVEPKEVSKRSRKRIQPRMRRAKWRCTAQPAGREGRPPERGLRRRAAPPPRPERGQARRREANTARRSL
eukprot:scaffold29346_cov66-Phaeocystis_antarctica.AAC.2